jgi:hypothetical protein
MVHKALLKLDLTKGGRNPEGNNLRIFDNFTAFYETEFKHLINQEKIEGVIREIHSVLTYQTENKRKGCINRDRNAVYNIRKLTKHFLETGLRLEKFKRETLIAKKNKKDT